MNGARRLAFLFGILVAVSHLWADMLHGPAAYALWGFFVLSGYLMVLVLVLTTKYGTTSAGLRAYAFNRFLRIYPPYIVAVALALATIALLPSLGVQLHRLDRSTGYPV